MNNIEKLAIEHGITITHNGYAGETDLLNIETAESFAKALQSSEAVAFLAENHRFKMSFDTKGKVNCFSNFEKELDGQWVALVGAENDTHLKFTHPPSSVPLEKYNKLLDALKLLDLEALTYIHHYQVGRNLYDIVQKAIAEAEGKEG